MKNLIAKTLKVISNILFYSSLWIFALALFFREFKDNIRLWAIIIAIIAFIISLLFKKYINKSVGSK